MLCCFELFYICRTISFENEIPSGGSQAGSISQSCALIPVAAEQGVEAGIALLVVRVHEGLVEASCRGQSHGSAQHACGVRRGAKVGCRQMGSTLMGPLQK